jgi:hypothetical protein
MTRLSLLGSIRNISAGKAPNNKPLKAVFGTIGCALQMSLHSNYGITLILPTCLIYVYVLSENGA